MQNVVLQSDSYRHYEAHLLLQSWIFIKANLCLSCCSCILQPPLGWLLASAVGCFWKSRCPPGARVSKDFKELGWSFEPLLSPDWQPVWGCQMVLVSVWHVACELLCAELPLTPLWTSTYLRGRVCCIMLLSVVLNHLDSTGMWALNLPVT